MATGLDGFADYLKHAESTLPTFQAEPYYEPETDSLIYYIRDESSYNKRLTKYFGVFLSNRDDSLVGIEVKGLKIIMQAVEDLGDVKLVDSMSVKGEDGDWHDLSVIVRCALVPEPDEPLADEEYAAFGRLTRGVRVNKRELCGS